ncbi:hypothetical protein JZ751_015882 [Albula glossodonta]|uniref:Uncharacterized protein n=1 Tax=Albula glossodonta TaxID=121402 RepID=A0A8T2MX00_9TELE|nr:hypothetical protein JZ751_015882 [Albula glossodonta]
MVTRGRIPLSPTRFATASGCREDPRRDVLNARKERRGKEKDRERERTGRGKQLDLQLPPQIPPSSQTHTYQIITHTPPVCSCTGLQVVENTEEYKEGEGGGGVGTVNIVILRSFSVKCIIIIIIINNNLVGDGGGKVRFSYRGSSTHNWRANPCYVRFISGSFRKMQTDWDTLVPPSPPPTSTP